MPTPRSPRTFITFFLLTVAGCDPSGYPNMDAESTDEFGTGTDYGTDVSTGSDTGETGSGSGGSTDIGETGECVQEFFTCTTAPGKVLSCLTCPDPDLVPCTCLDHNDMPVVCYALDVSLC